MDKRIIVLFIIIFCFLLQAKSQDIPLQGTCFNQKTKITDVVFYSFSNALSKNKYVNTYVVTKDYKFEDTLYVIKLILNKLFNNIEIIQENKHTEQLVFRKIKFENATPTCCVKNYRFNDTTINLSEQEKNDTILFTIADTTGKMFLHQFFSQDDNSFIKLVKFRNSYLEPHLEKAKLYWKVQDSIQNSIKKEQERIEKRNKEYLREIIKEKEAIRNDLTNVKKEINDKKSSLQKSTVNADGPLQKIYKHKMDSVFVKNFNIYCPFTFEINGTYNISVQLNHKILIISDPFPVTAINRPYFTWLKTQMGSINNDLNELLLENKKVPVLNLDSLLLNIEKNHKKRCDIYVVDLDANSKEFKNILDSVKTELYNFDDLVEVPINYIYDYTFNSKCYNENWICKNDSFYNINKASLYLSESNFIKLQVHKKYEKVKNGKYNVGLNKVEFNGINYDPTVNSLHRYYKFMTNIGISNGVFLGNNANIPSDVINSSYWEFFYIRHHFGFFCGLNFNDYLEGGMYIAPGNYFFFKIGVSGYNESNNNQIGSIQVNAQSSQQLGLIIGGSFIFPVIHFEGGFNTAVGLPYIMGGLNIPLNH